MMRIRARPIDLSSTARNGGENICDRACAAAASMSVLLSASFPCGRAFAQGGRFGPYWAGSACSGKALRRRGPAPAQAGVETGFPIGTCANAKEVELILFD